MAGTFQSKWYRINTYVYPDVGYQFHKNAFTAINDYFENHPGYERIASNYGYQAFYNLSGSGFSSMNNWVNNPWDGCWSVWRAVSASVVYDFALVASDTADISTFASSSWQWEQPFGGGIGVFLAAAYHPSGAWNGTTGNTGSDTFVTPWKSSSLSPIRCNGSDAENSSSLNATVRLTDTGFQFSFGGNDNLPVNVFLTGDNDTTFFAIETLKSHVPRVYNLAVLGAYTPASGGYNLPLTIFKIGNDDKNAERGTTIGSTTANTGGGGALKTTTQNPRRIRIEYPGYMITDTSKQSRVLEEDRFWEFPIRLYSYESGDSGYLGVIPNLRIGAFSAGGSHRFYNLKTRILFPIDLQGMDNDWGVLSVPWNGLLRPIEW